MISLPGYFRDPLVDKSQNDLFNLGTDLLHGDIPSYYRPIGEVGGSELENLIALTGKNVNEKLLSNAARVGNRGPIKSAPTALGEVETKLRYEDLLRAMEGRKFFFNTGNDMISGVRGAGLNRESNINSYELNKTRLAMEQDQFERNLAEKKKAEKAALYRSILSSGIGVAGNLYGIGMLSKSLSAGGGNGEFSGMPMGDSLYTSDYFNF